MLFVGVWSFSCLCFVNILYFDGWQKGFVFLDGVVCRVVCGFDSKCIKDVVGVGFDGDDFCVVGQMIWMFVLVYLIWVCVVEECGGGWFGVVVVVVVLGFVFGVDDGDGVLFKVFGYGSVWKVQNEVVVVVFD